MINAMTLPYTYVNTGYGSATGFSVKLKILGVHCNNIITSHLKVKQKHQIAFYVL